MDRASILSFRLEQNHLLHPIPTSAPEHGLLEAAEPGIQITSPGTLEWSLALRLRLEPAEIPAALEMALRKSKTLVEVTGIRGAGHVVPSHDFSLFTNAVYPMEEKELERLLVPVWKDFKAKRITATEVMATLGQATREILKGKKSLSQDEIHEAWRKKLPKTFLRACRGCQSHHVSYSAVAALGIRGDYCFGPMQAESEGGQTKFILARDWLPASCIDPDQETTRKALVRRFLKYYGPSSPGGFATWAGISSALAKEFFKLLDDEGELVEVEAEHAKGTLAILRRDLPALKRSKPVEGVWVLMPRDPILNLPDRELLAADKKTQQKLWRMIGNPGVLLVDGELAGTIKIQKKGTRLDLGFDLWEKISKAQREQVEQQVRRLAPARGCTEARFVW
jgi:hypothetical protein